MGVGERECHAADGVSPPALAAPGAHYRGGGEMWDIFAPPWVPKWEAPSGSFKCN